jgi:ABC-type glutathione transport system ATPase component
MQILSRLTVAAWFSLAGPVYSLALSREHRAQAARHHAGRDTGSGQGGAGPVHRSLPERYETVIGERGANLSGGQRQRLAIARALLRQPELLIFDEATSHLDTTTERAIQESLKTVLMGKTVVLVAHRLSTVKAADCIYVLQRGQIVQVGTHRELLAQEGMYRTLWCAQTDEIEGPRYSGFGRIAPPRGMGMRQRRWKGYDAD